MLTIPLQPAPKALPAATSPAKTSAGESEALPFGALLKALQQQLQKEQETNPLALAALAAITQSQPALVPESQPVEGQTGRSVSGKMSTTGPLPIKAATAQPSPQAAQLTDTNAALAVFPASPTESAPQASPVAVPAENQPATTSVTVQRAAPQAATVPTTSAALPTTFRIPESLHANQAISTASPAPANIVETGKPAQVPAASEHKAKFISPNQALTKNFSQANPTPETAQVTDATPTSGDIGVHGAADISQEADSAPQTAQPTDIKPAEAKSNQATVTSEHRAKLISPHQTPTSGDAGVQKAAEKAASAPETAQITGDAPSSGDVGGQKTVAGAGQEVLPPVAQNQVVATAQADKPETRPGRIQSKSPKSARTEKSAEPEARAGNLAAAASPLKEAATFKVEGKEFPIHSQQTEVVEQIARQLNAKIQSGTSTLRLELHPQDLGAIDVQMVSSPQGVSVTFFAEQPATGRLLEAQMGQLRQSLGEAGVQLSGLNIGQRGQEGGAFQQNTFAQPRNVVSLETTPAEPVAAQVTQPADGIDYLI